MDAAEGTSTGEGSRGRRFTPFEYPQQTIFPHGDGEMHRVPRSDERDGPYMSKEHRNNTQSESSNVSTWRVDERLQPLFLLGETIHRWRRPLVQLVKHYYIADTPYQELLVFFTTLFSDARRLHDPRERREVEVPLHLMPRLFPTNHCLELLTGIGFEYEGVDTVHNLAQCILYVPPSMPEEVTEAALTTFHALQCFTSHEANRLTMMDQEDANMLLALVQSLEAGRIQEQLMCSQWDKYEEFLKRMGITKQKHSRKTPSKFHHRQSIETLSFMRSFYTVIKSLHGAPLSEPYEVYI
ncbi:uncharacterized protein LOC135487076 [Lineus longissimus]|uniref:uncharacterized protein LOC135487076 n=1 Tax=Lineus longissimus TaxID=88925 RepID=UPI002B4D312F